MLTEAANKVIATHRGQDSIRIVGAALSDELGYLEI
jgi:hypothetical protein